MAFFRELFSQETENLDLNLNGDPVQRLYDALWLHYTGWKEGAVLMIEALADEIIENPSVEKGTEIGSEK